MRIGATATHKFTGITANGETISLAKAIYAQGGSVLLEKELEVNSGEATVTLSQEEVLKFNASKLAQVQIRVLTSTGKAYTSDIMTLKIYDGLDKTILGATPASEEE